MTEILVAHFRPDMVSGAEIAMADMAAQMDPRFRITMLVPGEGRLAEYYRGRGFDVWSKKLQTRRRIFPGIHEMQSLLITGELKRRRFEAVLSNTFAAASRIKTAARLAGLPLGIYVREFVADRPLYRRILAEADLLLAVSKDLQRHVDGLAGGRRAGLAYDLIDPGPLLARLQAHRQRGGRLVPFSSEHPIVGWVGRITPFKQPHLFVQAIPHVLAAFPEARFVMVGGAQAREVDYEGRVRRLAAELDVDRAIAFLGPRPDAVEILSECSVACTTSDREPLGRVILEAHLAGAAVVASDCGGPAEIVQDGVTGLLFPPFSPDSAGKLAACIVLLLRDEALRTHLIERATQSLPSTFSGGEHARILERHLEELIMMKKDVSK